MHSVVYPLATILYRMISSPLITSSGLFIQPFPAALNAQQPLIFVPSSQFWFFQNVIYLESCSVQPFLSIAWLLKNILVVCSFGDHAQGCCEEFHADLYMDIRFQVSLVRQQERGCQIVWHSLLCVLSFHYSVSWNEIICFCHFPHPPPYQVSPFRLLVPGHVITTEEQRIQNFSWWVAGL